MIIKVEKIDYHRNGVGGNGFNVVTFTYKYERLTINMVAVVFEEKGNVAVFDRDLLGKGVIEFGQNSWRGDNFEAALRKAIEAMK
jgi:hypothetical protein